MFLNTGDRRMSETQEFNVSLARTFILYWSMATFLKDTQYISWAIANTGIPHWVQNKTKEKKLALLTQFSSYATMWEKCPKTKAVKIKLPTFWPLARRGQSSPCLVSSDNCCDPALTDKPHLAHDPFLNNAIWKGQPGFLAKRSLEERKQGWGIGGSAYYIVCGNISKCTSWVLTPREWDLTPWGGS